MLSDWLAYLQYRLGAAVDAAGRPIADTSWSAQLQSSQRLWMLIEGSHVLALMLFAGTILFVDLRLVGLAFRTVPVSKVADSVLPYTIGGFGLLLLTGLALFFANPLEYYHDVAFRLKLVLLLAAAINVAVFHVRVQAHRAAWDALAKPPVAARISAAASLALWFAVIVAGRYMAYDWFKCTNPGRWVSAIAQCRAYDAQVARAEKDLAP